MVTKSKSYGWIPFWSHINFSNWAAQLCGISRETLQLSTFDSVVKPYPPPFPQALAEETRETWIFEPQTLPSGKKRQICVAAPSQSPNPGAADAPSSKAPGSPPLQLQPQPSPAKRGQSYSRLKLQGAAVALSAWYRDNSPTHFQLSPAVSAGCTWDVPSLPSLLLWWGYPTPAPPDPALLCQDPILLQIWTLKAYRKQELLRVPRATQEMTLVCYSSAGTGGNQGS